LPLLNDKKTAEKIIEIIKGLLLLFSFLKKEKKAGIIKTSVVKGLTPIKRFPRTSK
jgi:hypothetical protein